MATVVQNVTPSSVYTPYERPPQPYTLWSAIPRGLQSFTAFRALDAKNVNDNQVLAINSLLPPNFGYVFAYAFLSLTQNRAPDWDARCNINLQNFYRDIPAIDVGLNANYSQQFLTDQLDLGGRAMVQDNPWPAFPMIGQPGTTGIQCVLSANNSNDTVATAGSFHSCTAWWVFDLEQIRKFPINTPLPVHAR